MSARTRRIADRFGASVHTYDADARVQARAAAGLADDLVGLIPRSPETILEFGCGTGLLTDHLCRIWPAARLVATDIATKMAAEAGRRHDAKAVAMDAERPSFAESTFDLVCGSLAAQWFSQPDASLRGLQKLVAPGGCLAITSLGPTTLAEWRAARSAAGLAPKGLDYLPLETLAAIRETGLELRLSRSDRMLDHIEGAAGFLRGLRAIGADASEAPVDSSAALRRAMRELERATDAVTYEVITLIWQRTA